jgi:hypothetical protein
MPTEPTTPGDVLDDVLDDAFEDGLPDARDLEQEGDS